MFPPFIPPAILPIIMLIAPFIFTLTLLWGRPGGGGSGGGTFVGSEWGCLGGRGGGGGGRRCAAVTGQRPHVRLQEAVMNAAFLSHSPASAQPAQELCSSTHSEVSASPTASSKAFAPCAPAAV